MAGEGDAVMGDNGSDTKKEPWWADFYKRALTEARNGVEKVKLWRKHAEVARMAAHMWPDLVTSVSISTSKWAVIGVLIHTNVKVWADVKPIHDWLIGQGYELTGKHDDYPAMGRRLWPYGDLKLMAFINTSENAPADQCRCVQVGVKEEPVYEFVCPGDPVPAAEVAK